MREIVRIGRDQLARVGPAALSLRAVARELGVVSSAVYRYVTSRDELLTLLVVDAYDDLGETVDAAVASAADRGPHAQFLAAGRAIRAWALAEPSRYGLIFGTPVPGYEAPGEITMEPGTRVIATIVRLFEAAASLDALARPAIEALPDSLATDVEAMRQEFGFALEIDHLAAAVVVWTGVFGAISFEVFGQYGEGTFRDPAQMFEIQLDALARVVGLRPPAAA